MQLNYHNYLTKLLMLQSYSMLMMY